MVLGGGSPLADPALRNETVDHAIERLAIVEVRPHERLESRGIDGSEFGREFDRDLAVARVEQHEILRIDVAPVRRRRWRAIGGLRAQRDGRSDQNIKGNTILI